MVRAGDLHGLTGAIYAAKSGYYRVHLSNGTDAYFRGREVVSLAPMSDSERASLMHRRAAQLARALSTPKVEPAPSASSPSQWWFQTWDGAEGPRKRKPTQLYDAGEGVELGRPGGADQANASRGDAHNGPPSHTTARTEHPA